MPRQNRLKKFLNQKHRLMLLHPDTFEHKRSFQLSNKKLILGITFLSVFYFAISYLLLSYTPLKNTIPGTTDPQAEKKQIELIRQLNEMKIIVSKQDSFIHSIQKMSGFVSVDTASHSKIEKKEKVTYLPQNYLKKVEEELQKSNTVYENEKEISSKNLLIQGKSLVLFPPINGILTNKFDILDHVGIDLGSKLNEPVKAVADGYVILSEFSTDNGFVIGIAHEHNVISLYKHNSKILKKVGSYVKAGEPVAVVGNTGENSTGPHLHFELWIHGKPVNPLDYFSYIEK
ncbi:MAG: M23 family metallopeptidase [Candidatus Pacearchaeota archaeon]